MIISVRDFKSKTRDKVAFNEVLRSASVFFDGVESGLIYGELVGLMAQAIGPGNMLVSERVEKLTLVQFIMTQFNIREEEMITLHAPLAALSSLAMVEDVSERTEKSQSSLANESAPIIAQALDIALSMIELVPERTFSANSHQNSRMSADTTILASTSTVSCSRRSGTSTYRSKEMWKLVQFRSPPTKWGIFWYIKLAA